MTRRSTSPRRIPARAEIGPNEILVEPLDDSPDDFGRTAFFAYWHDDKTPAEGGPPDGVRGQRYFASLEDFTANAAHNGTTVRRWEP